MTKAYISAEIDSTEKLNRLLLQKHPTEALLLPVIDGLARMRTWVQRQWPLSDADKKEVNLGVYAVRNLAETFDDLTDALCKLENHLIRE